MMRELKKSEREEGVAMLRALAHPLRMEALEALRHGEKTVTELYQALGCTQPVMSQQLQVLECRGLVKTRREGSSKYCSLSNPDVLRMFDCVRRHLVDHMPGFGDSR